MTDSERLSDKQIEELLPFYVNGTLGEEERAAVEARAAENPALAREIAFLEGLSAVVREREAAEDDSMTSPGELGLKRLQRDLEAEGEGLGGVTPWRIGAFRLPVRQIALAASLALAIGLGAGSFLTYQLDERYLAASGGGVEAEGVVLQVIFRPDASEAEISALLRREGLSIVGGPSALGLYRLDSGLGPAEESALTGLIERLDREASVIEQVTVE